MVCGRRAFTFGRRTGQLPKGHRGTEEIFARLNISVIDSMMLTFRLSALFCNAKTDQTNINMRALVIRYERVINERDELAGVTRHAGDDD